jgi:hypothetical protein
VDEYDNPTAPPPTTVSAFLESQQESPDVPLLKGQLMQQVQDNIIVFDSGLYVESHPNQTVKAGMFLISFSNKTLGLFNLVFKADDPSADVETAKLTFFYTDGASSYTMSLKHFRF